MSNLEVQIHNEFLDNTSTIYKGWLHYILKNVLYFITPSGPIYKRNFGQQKLMYLVNNSV